MSARDSLAGRLGYVRADDAQLIHPEPLKPGSSHREHLGPVEPIYPQVIVVQGRPAGESWWREHGAALLLAFGFGVLALSVVAVVALVVIAVVVAMVVGMVGMAAVAAIAASGSGGKSSGGRRR
jgi:hypothetical protein